MSFVLSPSSCGLAAPLVLLAILVAGCAGRPPAAVPSAPRLDVTDSGCRVATVPIEWRAPADARGRVAHDVWCDTVGPPVVHTVTNDDVPATQHSSSALTIVSWNTHGGVADVDALLQALRTRPSPTATGAIVLLLQEVVRRSTDVPSHLPAGAPVPGSLHGPGRGEDVVALAARLGLSLVYVPSMRNGGDPGDGRPGEDRGNAILSSLPLHSPSAIELPLRDQRRVAVAATIGAPAVGQDDHGLRVVSFHLDTTSGRGQQAAFLGEWLQREARRGLPLLAAGDVNALWGTRDAAYHALASALPVEACGRGRTNRWPWRLHVLFGWWRGRLDYVFSTLPRDPTGRTCVTWPAYLGSDHLPVVWTQEGKSKVKRRKDKGRGEGRREKVKGKGAWPTA